MDEEDLESSDDEASVEEKVVWIHNRREVEGKLEYLVQYEDNEDEFEWVDRSDLWDYATVSRMICEYDVTNPIRWDTTCQFCGSEFNQLDDGCEECRCDECERPVRHLKGVNYGCRVHPVI